MLAVGIMSGTSLDGVDVALCEIKNAGVNTQIELLDFDTYELPNEIKRKIHKCAANELIEPAMLSSLNFELGEIFAGAVEQLCRKASIDSRDLGFIASHGQTIYHNPFPTDKYVPNTLQLGESAVIAARLETTVVSDFRVIDVAVGGQGAPLVPYSEFILYSDPKKTRALQNLGGIGNMTVILNTQKIEDIIAFDTGPGNMMIDAAMQHFYQESYDHGGEIGLKGELDPGLQQILMDHPYLKQALPKSTGREMFGESYVQSLLSKLEIKQPENIIATLSWFTAYCIAFHYEEYIKKQYQLDELIIGGGGSYNKAILSYLKELLPSVDILVQEDLGYSSDAKEAIAFVILGNETLHQQPSNVPSATGAKHKAVLGKIQYAPKI